MSHTIPEVLAWVAVTRGRWVNREELGSAADSIRVHRPGRLGQAREQDVAFFFSKDYAAELPGCRAGILITGEPFVEPIKKSGLPIWKNTAILACEDPYRAMGLVSEHLAPGLSSVAFVAGSKEQVRGKVHPSAIIDPEARVASSASIGAYCVIEPGAEIGEGTTLYPHCFIGRNARIGRDSVLFSNVSIYEQTQIGDRARLHAGCVIGADGFGYAAIQGPIEDGTTGVVGHQKIYHLGRVVMGDDVEVGANSCIDRGTVDDTIIGNNVKIDNLVQVGHNVRIGEGSILCGHVGIAGSATLGKFVYLGGLAGIRNGVHIGDRAGVGAMSCAQEDIPPKAKVMGVPQRAFKDFIRVNTMMDLMLKKRRKGGSSADE